ncbi:hypothetical protein [Haloarchaeobius sp. HRN-SO-5]|uniref:hypothetical protein n=1 Tax=Haloarchaeobius sp. HRN-SO-5 TaxID=3446118 RepID=UPI003EBBDD35
MSERFSEYALGAGHESVTFDELRSRHDSYPRPLGSYVLPTEQPEAICGIKKCKIEAVDGSSWKISAGVLDSGHLVVTDCRVLALFPRKEAPQAIAVQFADIVNVEKSSNWRTSKLILNDMEEYKYEFILDTDRETFEAVVEIGRNLNETVDSDESNAVKFLNEIDAEIASAEDAESVLHAIAELFEGRSEITYFDQAVAEANSIEELADRMATMPGFDNSQDGKSQSESTSSLTRPTVGVGGLRRRLSRTARTADPKDVGKYSLSAVLGFGAAAATAPVSTPLGIAALLAGGAATGAYASANPDSVAARIDPLQLAMSANTRGSQIRSSPGAGGHGTGAALGAVEYLSQLEYDDVDEAYAKWLAEVDIESVMDGHQIAARHARRSDVFENPRQASIVGGAAGLAYGYADMDRDIDQVVNGDGVEEIGGDTEG